VNNYRIQFYDNLINLCILLIPMGDVVTPIRTIMNWRS